MDGVSLLKLLIQLLPQLLVVIATILLATRKKTTWSVMLLIGATLSMIISISHYAFIIFGESYRDDRFQAFEIIGALSLLAHVIFAAGLLMLATESKQG